MIPSLMLAISQVREWLNFAKNTMKKNEPCSYSECGYEILEFSPNDVDYEALNKNFDDAMRMKKLAEEEEFRNKELAELARLKAKYEGQQDDLQ